VNAAGNSNGQQQQATATGNSSKTAELHTYDASTPLLHAMHYGERETLAPYEHLKTKVHDHLWQKITSPS